MNQELYITIFVTIAVIAITQAGEVGESSSKSQSNEHGSNFFEENNKLQNEEKLCDVTIIVGDKSFRAHKNILSSASPYFKAMFTNENMRESLEQSNEQTITLHELDAGAFEMLKDYMYTGRILIDDSTVQRLLAGASYLQMTNVEAHCCAHMKKEVNVENCIGIKYIADKYSCSELSNYATDLILDSFEEVAKSGEFFELTKDQLTDIISEDTLNVNSEEKVHEATMRWIKYKDSSDGDRTFHLPDILQHVRFSQMDQKYLEQVSRDPLIQKYPECLEYVKEAKDYLSIRHLNVKRADDKASLNARFKPRKTDYLFAVGGEMKINENPTSSVERYDPKTNKWTEVASMNSPRKFVGVAAVSNNLYAVGGLRVVGSYLSSTERYDPHTNKWTDNVKPLESARTTYNSVATFNGNFYVMGSPNSFGGNSVVKYNPNTNEWIECKPLRHRRLGYAVGVMDGYIYVLGGVFDGTVLDTVERYDSKQSEWYDVSPMITKRNCLGATAHRGYLYAVGGLGDNWIVLNSAERYDSRGQKWEEIAPMTEYRWLHGLAVANGLIYAVGGDCDHKSPNSVEVYDPATNKWSKRAPMLHARSWFGLAVAKY